MVKAYSKKFIIVKGGINKMTTVLDVRKRFQRMPFFQNAMLTIIVGFRFEFPKVMTILITNGKNEKRTNFKSKQSYINYLNS